MQIVNLGGLINSENPTRSLALVKNTPGVLGIRLPRITALDIVRGYAMLLMLISHSSWWVPDLEYGVAYGWDNLITPSLILPQSLMGFVLQLATPTFFLLAGFGISLFTASRYRKGWSEWQITRYFLIRGALLIVLDLTVINFRFEAPHYANHTAVLTSVGLCVMAMALLRRLPWSYLLGLMLLILVGTQLYYYNIAITGNFPQEESILRSILLTPTIVDISWKTQFPALAWLPIVLLGFITSQMVLQTRWSLPQLCLRIGFFCLFIFGLVWLGHDFGNLYFDDPIIFVKNPPDLAYLSLYVGLAYLIIALHSITPHLNLLWPWRIVATLGQTALFFYLIHIRLIELLSPLFNPLELPPLLHSLAIVLFALPILIIACRIYLFYRRKYPDSVLKYL